MLRLHNNNDFAASNLLLIATRTLSLIWFQQLNKCSERGSLLQWGENLFALFY